MFILRQQSLSLPCLLYTSFDGLDNYVFTALSKNLGQSELTVIPIISDKDFYVIQLADVPSDWKSVSLRIKVDDPSKTDILKCYANTESVQTCLLYTSSPFLRFQGRAYHL